MSKASDFFNVGSGIWHPLNNTMKDSLQVTSDASPGWQTVSELVGPVLISSAKLQVIGGTSFTYAEIRMFVDNTPFPTLAIDGTKTNQSMELDLIGGFGVITAGQIGTLGSIPAEPVYCQSKFRVQVRLVSTSTIPSPHTNVITGSCAYTFGEYI